MVPSVRGIVLVAILLNSCSYTFANFEETFVDPTHERKSNNSDYKNECGGTVPVGGEPTTIEYITPEGYRDNEFCVWLLEPALAYSGYSVDYVRYGLQRPNDGLTFYNWNQDGVVTTTKISTRYFGSTISLNQPFAAIAFSSIGNFGGAGFQVKVRGTGNLEGDLNYRGFVLKETQGNFSYPQDFGIQNYKSKENVAVVVQNPFWNVTSFYIEGDLKVYELQTYNDSGAASLIDGSKGSNPDGVPSLWKISNLPRLFLFHSNNGSNAGKGFSISWKPFISNECGGIIEVGRVKTAITYLPTGSYGEKELCVWVLLPTANYSGLSIDYAVYGMEQRQGSYNWGGLTFFNWDGNATMTTTKIKPTKSQDTISLSEPYAAIAFSSSSGGKKGRALQVIIEGTGQLEGQFTHRRFVLKQTEGNFSYPQDFGLENYDPNERVMIVVQSPLTTRTETTIDFTDIQDDSLMFYKSKMFTWDDKAILVGKTNGLNTNGVPSQDLTWDLPRFFLFHSNNNSNTGKGFSISWKPIGIGESTYDYDESSTTPAISECGGSVHVGYEEIVINYLPPGGYKNNEFCVWMLLPTAAYSGLSIDYVPYGVHGRFDGVIIHNWNEDGIITTTKIEPNDSKSKMSLSKPYAAIAFSTDDSWTGKGFQVTIKGIGHLEGHFNFRGYAINPTQSNFLYPDNFGQENYKPNDRVAVVVQNPKWDATSFVSVNYTDIQDDLLMVYQLRTYQDGGVADLIGKTNGSNPDGVPSLLTLSNLPRLLLFHSNNNSISGKGFSISWTPPTLNECGGSVQVGPGETIITYLPPVGYENQFCVWTVVPSEAYSGYSIDYVGYGEQQFRVGVAVYNWDEDGNITTTRTWPRDFKSRISLSKPYAAIAFSTYDGQESQGFQVTIIGTGHLEGHFNYRVFAINPTQQSFSYPEDFGQQNYKQNERVAVVVHNPLGSATSFVSVNYTDIHDDILMVYQLQPLYMGGLADLVGTTNGSNPEGAPWLLTGLNLPRLILFHSNSNSISGKGFSLSWQPPTSDECGGSIQVGPGQTVINYFRLWGYKSNEFCVWTLVPSEAYSGYSIDYFAYGVQRGRDDVAVYSWNEDGIITTTHTGPNNSKSRMSLSKPYAAIAFATYRGKTFQGFQITIEGTGRLEGDLNYRVFAINPIEENFSYPEDFGLVNYKPNSRVTVVAKKPPVVSVNYTDIHDDLLMIYELQLPHKGGIADLIGMTNGSNPEGVPRLLTLSSFPRLILFHSNNNSNTGKGFSLSWKPPTANDCGGSVQIGAGETVISYFPAGGYKNNEFCVWVLMPAASYSGLSIDYVPYSVGIYDGVTSYNWDEDGTITTTPIGSGDSRSRTSLSKPYAAIAFSSNERFTGLGFQVTIKGTGHLEGNFNYQVIAINSNQESFSYPEDLTTQNYNSNERVTVVVQNPIWNVPSFVSVNFTDICDDFLKVYQLQTHEKGGAAELVGTTNGSNLAGVPGLMTISNLPRLLLFHSNNNSNSGKGFSLSWTPPTINGLNIRMFITETNVSANVEVKNQLECGGTVRVGAEETIINYLPPGGFNGEEFCVWTLLPTVSYRGLSIEYVPYGVNAEFHGVVLYNWNQDGIISTTKIEPSNLKSTKTFSKPYAAIAFSTFGGRSGQGFRIIIKGIGHMEGEFNYRGFAINPNGEYFSYPEDFGQQNYKPNERVAVVVQNPIWDVKSFVSVNYTDIHDDLLIVYQLLPHYEGGVADLIGTTNGFKPEGVPTLLTSSGLPRLLLFHSNNNSNTGKGFSLSWNPHTNECGGTVQVGSGETVLNYFPPGGYKNNEFCVWTLVPAVAYSGLSIEYEPYGLQRMFDGVTVYNWDEDAIITTNRIEPSNSNSKMSLSKPYAAIAFSTDDSSTGQGFRVTIRGTGHLQGDFNFRGFVLKQTQGNFSYPDHFGLHNYAPNERVAVVVQTYSVYNNNHLSIDYTHTRDDTLKIFELPPYNMWNSGTGSNPPFNSNLPRLLIFHSNNNSITGKGFSMSWKPE